MNHRRRIFSLLTFRFATSRTVTRRAPRPCEKPVNRIQFTPMAHMALELPLEVFWRFGGFPTLRKRGWQGETRQVQVECGPHCEVLASDDVASHVGLAGTLGSTPQPKPQADARLGRPKTKPASVQHHTTEYLLLLSFSLSTPMDGLRHFAVRK
jgi:hypothetical protein